jgi:prepilin-type processing-associated H-X9-DG protein
MNAGGTRQKSAFTLIEVIAIAVAIALFLVLMLVGVQHAKREALKKQCVSNLRDIGISMRGFGIDPIPDSYMMVLGGMHRTPERLGETHRYFLSVTNELRTPNILICPADTKRSPAKSFEALTTANLSYFVGVDSGDTVPSSFMAGDDNITVNGLSPLPGLLQIPLTTPVAWTNDRHKKQGNILFGDGSVRDLSTPQLMTALAATTFPANRLAMP